MRTARPVLMALCLVLAACGGGGGGDDVDAAVDDGVEDAADQGDAAASDGAEPGSDGDGEAGANADGEAGVEATGGTGTTDSGSASTPTPDTSGGQGSGGSSGSSGEAASTVGIAPGTYTYDQTGSFKVGVTEESAPPKATLTADPIKGTDQATRSESGGEDAGRQILRFTDAGVFIVELRIAAGGLAKNFEPAKPVLLAPAEPKPGQSWTWKMTSTDGKTTVKTTSTFTRTEKVTVGGKKVQAWVIDTDVDLSGDIVAHIDLRTWSSPDHALIVKDDSKITGTFGAIAFSGESKRTLRSLTPK